MNILRTIGLNRLTEIVAENVTRNKDKLLKYLLRKYKTGYAYKALYSTYKLKKLIKDIKKTKDS